jgi:hypothetical protein
MRCVNNRKAALTKKAMPLLLSHHKRYVASHMYRSQRDSTQSELFGLRSINGTYTSAATAIDANIGVDLVMSIALRDCFNGTLSSASATGNTIVIDLVCHNESSL